MPSCLDSPISGAVPGPLAAYASADQKTDSKEKHGDEIGRCSFLFRRFWLEIVTHAPHSPSADACSA